jgi:hypothetical protein
VGVGAKALMHPWLLLDDLRSFWSCWCLRCLLFSPFLIGALSVLRGLTGEYCMFYIYNSYIIFLLFFVFDDHRL